MKQEKFTEQAQEALASSQQLVRQYKHNQWDVEHILMALLQQEKGLVSDIIKERMDKMSKIVDAAAKKVLKKLGLN